MTIVIDCSHVSSLISALDLYSRIFMGQYSEIEWCLRLNTVKQDKPLYELFDSEELRSILLKVREKAIPDLKGCGFNISYGIWSEKNDIRSVEAFDLQQVIRHFDAWHRHPEGGSGRNFDKPWIHGRFSKMKASCKGTRETYILVLYNIEPEQYELMCNAVKSAIYLHELKFVPFIKMFTDNKEAIEAMENVESLFDEIDVPESFYDYRGLLEDSLKIKIERNDD